MAARLERGAALLGEVTAPWERLLEGPHLPRELLVVPGAGVLEQGLDRLLGEAHEGPGGARQRLPAALDDLPVDPGGVLARPGARGQDVDRVLDGDRSCLLT
jgi:hypothetical protein